jgi:hypothetical protein
MTPKEKAIELAIKFTSSTDVVKPNLRSKEMALKCVDEIIEYLKPLSYDVESIHTVFWNDVKQEIEKL